MIFIINTLQILYAQSCRETRDKHGFRGQQVYWGGKSSAVTEAIATENCLCRGGSTFCSSVGCRKYSLASSQFTLTLGLHIRIEQRNGEKEKDM